MPRRAAGGEARAEIHEADDTDAIEALAVGVERMRGEIEADGVELVLQPLHRRPVLHHRQVRPLVDAGIDAAEQADLLALALARRGAGVAQQEIAGLEALRAVGVERVEGAGLDQRFELPLVERFGVDAPGEIEEILEAALGLALGDQVLHGCGADALHRREGVADGGARRRLLDRELDLRAVDVGRHQLDAKPVQFLAEYVELVGVAQIERHRGGEELDR